MFGYVFAAVFVKEAVENTFGFLRFIWDVSWSDVFLLADIIDSVLVVEKLFIVPGKVRINELLEFVMLCLRYFGEIDLPF